MAKRLVVHVVPYYAPHKGGMELAAEQIARHQATAGAQVHVFTSRIGAKSVPKTERDGTLTVSRLPGPDIAHTPLLWTLPYRLLKLSSESVLHVHVAQAFIPDVAYMIGRLRKIPVFAHYHLDVDPSGVMGFLLRPYQRHILARTMRGSTGVIVPTPDYRDIVMQMYGVARSKIHIVPSATTYRLRSEVRNFPTKKWRLLSVGRLSDQKNYALLIEAISALRRKHPATPFVLDIYGEGELRAELQTQIDIAELAPCVRLHRGNLATADMQAVYDAADLFVLATRKEAFGIVYVEAMSKGLPIVTTDVPGTRNVVKQGRNGVLVAETAEAIADGLYVMMTTPGLATKFSRQNLEDARAYTWPSIASQIMDVYAQVPQ